MYSQSGRWCDLWAEQLLGSILSQSEYRASGERRLLYILALVTVAATRAIFPLSTAAIESIAYLLAFVSTIDLLRK